MLKYSLLDEQIFAVDTPQGAAAHCTLPEVLARLSHGENLVFTALRPHQQAPLHAFLVQLAYLALEGEEIPQLQAHATAWRERLRALTARCPDDGPWCLINEDWQQPAFLQSPCSAGRIGDYKHSVESAQDIDLLVTAKHHDEKRGKLPLDAAHLDVLVYALIDLQGGTPYFGATNYNSMRMNGGHSSRSQLRLAFSRGTGPEFLRDLRALIDGESRVAEEAAAAGIGTASDEPWGLLWLAPWGDAPLALAEVHPLCLEVCRRVRLVEADGRLLLRRAGSKTMRIDAKERKGAVADPWIPVVVREGVKALTAQSHSFSYRDLQKLLFDREQFRLPLLAEPSAAERRGGAPATLVAQVLVREEGGTDGWLYREVLMPPAVLSRLVDEPTRLAQRSQQFVDLAGRVSGKAWRSALLQFVDGSEDVDWKNKDFDRAVAPWVDRFERHIDGAFFGVLFDSFEAGHDDTTAQQAWARWLAAAATGLLPAATQALPTRDGSRLFAHARAQRLLQGSLHKQLGPLLTQQAATDETAAPIPEEPTNV